MNLDEFDAVFDRFQGSAFRLETLTRYADDEDEEFAIFFAGKVLPERSARTVPWLKRVADTSAAGAQWRRVHVLSYPLTNYLRFEMIGYQANVAAGKDIRIVDRGNHPELAALRRDFSSIGVGGSVTLLLPGRCLFTSTPPLWTNDVNT